MATGSLIPHLQNALLALSLSPDCSVNADAFPCRLLSVLHLLYVLGAVLVVILAFVIVFAIRAWYAGRNNQDIPSPKSEHEPRHD